MSRATKAQRIQLRRIMAAHRKLKQYERSQAHLDYMAGAKKSGWEPVAGFVKGDGHSFLFTYVKENSVWKKVEE